MNRVLMKAIVDFVLFLNLSGEDIVDLRASVQQLEQLSTTLKGLTPQDRAVFAQYVKELVEAESPSRDYDRRVETLLALVQDLE